MTTLKVRTMLHLVEVLGGREVAVELPEDSSLAQLLGVLAERSGAKGRAELFLADGRLQPHVRVLINGQQPQFLDGLETVLRDGDEVLIIPPAAGG